MTSPYIFEILSFNPYHTSISLFSLNLNKKNPIPNNFEFKNKHPYIYKPRHLLLNLKNQCTQQNTHQNHWHIQILMKQKSERIEQQTRLSTQLKKQFTKKQSQTRIKPSAPSNINNLPQSAQSIRARSTIFTTPQ